MFNSRLRIYIEPDSLHCLWNDVKNAYKRSECQPALLLGILLCQTGHGPFLSAGNQWTKQEVAELLGETMTESDFQDLREAMLQDRYNDPRGLPDSPSDIAQLPAVQNLPIYDIWLHKYQSLLEFPPLICEVLTWNLWNFHHRLVRYYLEPGTFLKLPLHHRLVRYYLEPGTFLKLPQHPCEVLLGTWNLWNFLHRLVRYYLEPLKLPPPPCEVRTTIGFVCLLMLTDGKTKHWTAQCVYKNTTIRNQSVLFLMSDLCRFQGCLHTNRCSLDKNKRKLSPQYPESRRSTRAGSKRWLPSINWLWTGAWTRCFWVTPQSWRGVRVELLQCKLHLVWKFMGCGVVIF